MTLSFCNLLLNAVQVENQYKSLSEFKKSVSILTVNKEWIALFLR